MSTSTVARTKAHLIDTLVQRGLSRSRLTHLSLRALDTLIDETQGPRPRLAALAASADQHRAVARTPRQHMRRPSKHRPAHVGELAPVFNLNHRWSSGDRNLILQLAAEHGADNARSASDGQTVAVLNGSRVLFWVSRHQVGLPSGSTIRLSTARPFD